MKRGDAHDGQRDHWWRVRSFICASSMKRDEAHGRDLVSLIMQLSQMLSSPDNRSPASETRGADCVTFAGRDHQPSARCQRLMHQ